MTTTPLQKAAMACQAAKTRWQDSRQAWTKATLEMASLQADSSGKSGDRLAYLRELIAVKQWEMNQHADRYLHAHDELLRVSVRTELRSFMQRHGTELLSALAPELMGLNHQPELLRTRAADRALEYLREALAVSMAISPAIEYAEASRDILNSAGLRPETAARQDAISRTTPAENLKFMHRKIALEQQCPA